MTFYLPLIIRFALFGLIFGGIAFLLILVRRRGLNPLESSSFVTGLVPPGPLTSKPRPATPPMIGPYQIASTLGQGGMGTVLKARNGQGRDVALKMIGGAQLHGTALRRQRGRQQSRMDLVREARLAAELRHRNIVEILDIGQHKGALYIVMELLEGASLDRYARAHPITAPEALRIVAQVCDALDYAHKHGIIHRDIKPLNVYMTGDGTVKVLDFGLAVPAEEAQINAAVAGTFFYMSPEQILGHDLDGRSDIWAAGVTLFQLLTTRVPFQGRSLSELRDRILNSPTPKLPFTGPISQELNRVLEKALAKKREERYASAREFARDLRTLMRTLEPGVATLGSESVCSDPETGGLEEPRIGIQFAYEPVSLGFGRTSKARVFVPTATVKRGVSDAFVQGLLSSLKNLLISPGCDTLYIAISTLIGFAMLLPFAAPFALLELVRPPAFYLCRSCRRRMRVASTWDRPTWLMERGGFCEPDCIAALKSGMWEEAVKLLRIHTSEGESDRRFRLQFFECSSCFDQRAYFTRETKSATGWGIEGICEAYRFGKEENAERFVASTRRLNRSRSTVESMSFHSNPLENKPDVHDLPTV